MFLQQVRVSAQAVESKVLADKVYTGCICQHEGVDKEDQQRSAMLEALLFLAFSERLPSCLLFISTQ